MSNYLFVTGRLAADSLISTIEKMSPDFDYEVKVLPISVAAFMDTAWISQHIQGELRCDHLVIPGLCPGDLSTLEKNAGVPVIRGPKDLKSLPALFGHETVREGYGQYHTKILAEIPEAFCMQWEDILPWAEYYRDCGADIIDLGCPARGGFDGVGEVVSRLKEHGFVVSVDTFDAETILRADAAGVDMVLSVNSNNMEIAPQLHCKVVVVPDFDEGLPSLEQNITRLEALGIPYVIDPILNPICFGLTQSIVRYYEMRSRYPDVEMLMGVGNLTELTDADSTGINALLAGIIAELGIEYALTTEVISWARGSVRELDIARRLMHYAQKNRVLPKFLDDGLLTIKDPIEEYYTEAELRQAQAQVNDPNFRIYCDNKYIYVFNDALFIKGTDPGSIFARLGVGESSHAFYLGRELEKAALAVHLGKKYIQEEPLRWGYLSDSPLETPSCTFCQTGTTE